MASIVAAPQRRDAAGDSQEGDGVARSITRQVIIALAAIVCLAVLYFFATAQAIMIINDKGVTAETERARMALAQTIVLDPEVLAAIEAAYQLHDLRLVLPDRIEADETSIPTDRTDGRVLAWTPRQIATETFLSVAPMRIGAGLLLILTIGFILHRLNRLAWHLDRRLVAARSQALEDPLTGVASRRGFDEAIAAQLARLEADGEGAALVLLDLDGFKEVNDRLGHLAGDQLLRETARRIEAYARPDDIVARLGGDEFAILRRSGLDREALSEFAADLVHLLSAPCAIDGHVAHVSVSIGIAQAPQHAREANELVDAADAALYRAKAGSGGSFAYAMARPYPQVRPAMQRASAAGLA